MKKNNAKLLISILLGICVSVAIYVLMYIQAVRMFQESKEIRIRISEATAKEQEMETIRKDVKATFNDYEKIQSVFVGSEATVDFIQSLESIGREIGVVTKIESVTNQELTPKLSDKEELVVNLTALGSQANVVLFLKLLENLPYKISIHNAIVQKIDGNTNIPVLTDKKVTGAWQFAANLTVIKQK